MAGKYHIKAQYTTWMATVTLGTTLALTGVHVWRAMDTEEAASRRVAPVIARVAAQAIQQALVETNLATIVRELDQVVCHHKVEYCTVRDTSDQVLFQPTYPKVPVNLIIASQAARDGNRKLGLVGIGIVPTSLVSRTRRTLLKSLGIGAGLLGGALWVSMFASKPVVSALQSLEDFVRRVGRGKAKGEALASDLNKVDWAAQEINALVRRIAEQQERLKRTQQRVKSTQKKMEENIYVIRHDLKEPMRGIEGGSKLLADGYCDKLDNNGQHFIHRIRNAVSRMQAYQRPVPVLQPVATETSHGNS